MAEKDCVKPWFSPREGRPLTTLRGLCHIPGE